MFFANLVCALCVQYVICWTAENRHGGSLSWLFIVVTGCVAFYRREGKINRNISFQGSGCTVAEKISYLNGYKQTVKA